MMESVFAESASRRIPYKLALREARRKARREARREGDMPQILVAVVETSRHYGGPEEGGWYYDVQCVVRVVGCWGWRRALAVAREMREEHPQPRYSRGSVLGGADVTIHICASSEEVEALEYNGRQPYE
jgi:hypothetical protein